MKKYISSIKSFVKGINKQNTKEFMLVHKNVLIVMIAIILLGGIITAASYAYYQTLANQSIVGGQVGVVPNINMYVFVEDKNASTGAGLGTYSRSVYIPQYAYTYNSSLSYCKKGSTLTYNSTTHTFSISNNKDACYVYFDASVAANADIVLDVYQLKNGEYKKINGIPNGYELNTTLSSCTNGATMTMVGNEITINSTNRTVCNAYLEKANVLYWNASFDKTYWYAYPLGQKTSDGGNTWTSGSPATYTTLAQLQSNTFNYPVYIKTTTEHQVCLYYNSNEFCFSEGFWDTDPATTGLKLQTAMETALGTSASNCYTGAYYAKCEFGSNLCTAYVGDEAFCYSLVSDSGCYVYPGGSAFCGYDFEY